MALAESSDSDADSTAFKVEGITFVVNRAEARHLSGLTVDYRQTRSGEGFVVEGPCAC